MHLHYRNVNDAFYYLIRYFQEDCCVVRTTSRVGDVLQIPEVMTITYTHPTERVLFNTVRDANPFLHLYEALWMLAGRNDIASLAYFSKDFPKFVQDGDSPVQNGAYGYRWRHAFAGIHDEWGKVHPRTECDQLAIIIDHLKRKPESRRVVLAMWNVEDDLLKMETSKDVCCNLDVLFSIRHIPYTAGSCGCSEDQRGEFDGQPSPTHYEHLKGESYLDMTVFNRSNDLILGMLGANYVHFTMLQEYMACCLGAHVGFYNQVSNNLHVYVNNFKPKEWQTYRSYMNVPYPEEGRVKLVAEPAVFDAEVKLFAETYGPAEDDNDFTEPFLRFVARPMMLAYRHHKRREYEVALSHVSEVQSADWKKAAHDWITQRHYNWKEKQKHADDKRVFPEAN